MRPLGGYCVQEFGVSDLYVRAVASVPWASVLDRSCTTDKYRGTTTVELIRAVANLQTGRGFAFDEGDAAITREAVRLLASDGTAALGLVRCGAGAGCPAGTQTVEIWRVSPPRQLGDAEAVSGNARRLANGPRAEIPPESVRLRSGTITWIQSGHLRSAKA